MYRVVDVSGCRPAEIDVSGAREKEWLFNEIREDEKIMEEKPKRRSKPKRVRTEALYFKVTAEMKQAMYDIADKREMTLTAVIEEMIRENYEKFVGGKVNEEHSSI